MDRSAIAKKNWATRKARAAGAKAVGKRNGAGKGAARKRPVKKAASKGRRSTP